MKWLFIILCFLLLLLGLEPAAIPAGGRYALLWQVSRDVQLLRIFPQRHRVLVERGVPYLYRDGDDGGNDDTYVPAMRLDNGRIHQIWNHRYLWLQQRIPTVLECTPARPYTGVVDFINCLVGGS